MNLQYLNAFYTTARLNSISKAAKTLHLTQPGLSMQIQSLEKELGETLLIRSNKGVRLTEAGKIVFDYADTILSMQENIERDLKNLKNQNRQLLLGACKSVGEFALPCSIYTFKQAHQQVEIQFDICNTAEVLEKIRDRSINIGIIQGEIDSDDLIQEPITKDQLMLVTSDTTTPSEITLEELKRLPLIFRESGSGTREVIKRRLKHHEITLDQLNLIYFLNSMEAIKSSVISGKGISFIPRLSIQRELKEGMLREIKVKGLSFDNFFYVAYRRDYRLMNHELHFIDFIKSPKRGFC